MLFLKRLLPNIHCGNHCRGFSRRDAGEFEIISERKLFMKFFILTSSCKIQISSQLIYMLSEIRLTHVLHGVFPSAGTWKWTLMEQTDAKVTLQTSLVPNRCYIVPHTNLIYIPKFQSVTLTLLKLLSLFTCVNKMVESRASSA